MIPHKALSNLNKFSVKHVSIDLYTRVFGLNCIEKIEDDYLSKRILITVCKGLNTDKDLINRALNDIINTCCHIC